MTGLETTYYIYAIIFMSIMLLLLITIVVAILVIRNKVIKLEKTIEEKLDSAVRPLSKVVEIANAVQSVARAVK